MSVRILPRAILSAVLLLLAAGPDLARSWQSTEPPVPAAVSTSPGVNAPWFVDEIDTAGDTGLHASVAYDPSRATIYVSYYDATNQRLRLARSDGLPPEDCGLNGDWGCMTLDSGPDVGKYSSIAINPVTGGIGVAYYDATNGKLKYIVFENPRLLVHQTYTIDKGITGVSWTGLYPSLKYSEDGKPHIAYYFHNPSGVDALMLAYYTVTNGNCGYDPDEDEDTWRCHTIISGEGMGQYPSLVATTAPWGWAWYISFYDASSGDLWYARPVVDPPGNCGIYGDDMACYQVALDNDVGRYSSLYLDSAGDFHIAYYDATAEALMYAAELPGNCGLLNSAQCDVIDSMLHDYHPLGISIAEDPGGHPAIAYQGADESLKLARPLAALGLPGGSGDCGPEDPYALWSCQTIDSPPWWSDYRNGDFVSLNIAPSGLAQIAYNGFILSSGGNLYVAYQLPYRVYLPLVLRNG